MKYNEHMGITYDTIIYGLIDFNRQYVIEKYKQKGHNLNGAFSYFDEVQNSCGSLPECLLPFFYYNADAPCFLTVYLLEHINFRNHTVEDFIDLCKDKITLKKSVFHYLFRNLSKDEIRKIADEKDGVIINKVFHNQQWSAEMKKETMFMLYNFELVSKLLVKNLKKISENIIRLHEKYHNKIAEKIEETHSKENLILYEKLYSLNEKKAGEQFFSMCFMNQYVRTNKSDLDNESVFIFGYRYKETMEADCNGSNISLETVLTALGDSVRFRIIECLVTHGKLTASDLSRITNISNATVYRSVDRLIDERVIKQNHQEGRKIYYSVNEDYMLAFGKLTEQFINKFKYKKESAYEQQGTEQKY